ncbi:MAG: DUF5049 domain-containing protein [Clostridiales bacterium]|nr:DUF5049 domain-containing protein [Clostridiales bacterium]
MTDETLSELLAIRDSGVTNMCDTKAVRAIAAELDFDNLVEYIDRDKGKSYFHFILYGEEPESK